MKRLLALLLAMAFLLAGCAQQSGGGIPSSEEASVSEALERNEEGMSEGSEPSSQAVEKIQSPALDREVTKDGALAVLRYWGDGKIYTRETISPFTGKDMLSVVEAVAGVLPKVKEPLPIRSITREKSFVTVDFDEILLDQYSKGELYEILTTISVNLLELHLADSVCFLLDGEVGIFGEIYTPEPLAFTEIKPAVVEEILANIPYQGLSESYSPFAEELEKRFGLTADETAMEIMELLSRVGRIEADAASPQELNPSRLFYHCTMATPWFSPSPQDPNYAPPLLPLADVVSAKLGMQETMFWLEPHLQETARLLCGEDYVLPLSEEIDLFGFRYFPKEGVVAPPHMGGGYRTLPLVLSYEEIPDGYCAEVVYLYDTMGGTTPWGEELHLAENELADYVKTKATRAEVVVRRENGTLRFVSYKLL